MIIASRDRRPYLVDLVADLQMQTARVQEIIIVDQSSPAYEPIAGTHIIQDSGEGPCRARNLGVSYATGEVVVFIDDDARVEPTFIEELCSPILARMVSAATGSICSADGEYPENPAGWNTGTNSWIMALTANPKSPLDGSLTMNLSGGCGAIRKSVFLEIGGFDLFFDPNGAAEDREIALRLFQAGYCIQYRGAARLWHIGASDGGRRGVGPPRLNVLEANLFYTICKHFSPELAHEYQRLWRRRMWARTRGIGIRRIPRFLRDLAHLSDFCADVEDRLKVNC